MTSLPSAISLHNVTVAYERHPAIHHVEGVFAAGSLTAIVGPNGAGKSSLIKAIVGLVRPSDGRIDLHGRHRREIAYLPQLTAIDEAFPITVRDAVLLGHWRRLGAWRGMSAADCDAADHALAQVGLTDFADRLFGSLSIGQRQRVLFARLIVADCPLILLDEPFSAIDQRTTADLMRLVLQWHAQGRTIVAVLHDNALVHQFFPESLLLARRVIAWGATATALSPDHLQEAATSQTAWQDHAAPCEGAA